MSSISLNRASATLIATRSANPSASLRKASSARPSAVPQAAIQAPIEIRRVQPHLRARALIGLKGGDECAELFEGRHRLQHSVCAWCAGFGGRSALQSRESGDSPDPIGNPGAAQCRPLPAAEQIHLRRAPIICGPAAATRTAASPTSSCSTTWCSCLPSRSSRTGCLEHLTPLGAVQTAVLMLAVWWAWIDTAWITNWLNPERTAVRLMLFATDAGRARAVGVDPEGVRRPRAAVRPIVCRHAGRPQPVHALGAEEPRRRQLPEFHPHRPLAEHDGVALDRRSLGGRPGPADAVGRRGRHRNLRAAVRLLGAGARPLGHHRLGRRGRPHGRALRPVRHHRARRVGAGHRRDVRGPRPGTPNTSARSWWRSPAASPCG